MRTPFTVALTLVLALPLGSASAQAHPADDLGTVTGHILCSDTQRPARLAEIRLVPTGTTSPDKGAKKNVIEDDVAFGGQLPPVQTDMSGAYTVHNVKPGTYYLRVDYEGYLTPLLSFTRDQLAKPTVDVKQRIANELQIVTVAPKATTRADASLLRGASISGTVRYDDGSPAVGVGISLYRRNAKGEFKDEYQNYRYTAPTDDHGHYHLDSLPAADFVVSANFSISEGDVQTMAMPNGGNVVINIQKVLFSLPLYSGDSLRLKSATVVKTDAGSDTPGVDLTLPLSKLHAVSGTVLAKDGHPVSAGKVALLYADTREELTNVPISRENGEFHFLYVPEADYVLAVQQASDVTQTTVNNPPGMTPRTHTEDKTTHTYGTSEQPLSVQNDVDPITATVPNATTPDKPPTPLP